MGIQIYVDLDTGAGLAQIKTWMEPFHWQKCQTNAWRELGGGGGGGGGGGVRRRYRHARAIDLKRGISSYKHVSRTQTRA